MPSFFEDEEIGGALGMRKFVQSDVFKAMNVGFALDEGKINGFSVFPFCNFLFLQFLSLRPHS